MKQKIERFLLGAILLSAVMLCSCSARSHITLECENLPNGYCMEVLVKLDKGDSDYNDNAKSGYIYPDAVTQTGSESDGGGYTSAMTAEERYRAFLEQAELVGDKHLYYYNEDGWISARYFLGGSESADGKFYFPSHYSNTGEFVEGYPELKIAVTDSEGRVIQVSDAVKMLPEGKAFYYAEIDYDYAQNTAVAADPKYLSADGKRPSDGLLTCWLVSFLSNAATLVFIVVMLAARSRGNHRHYGYALAFGILSLGNILFTAKFVYLEINPRYDLDSDGLTVENLKMLFNLNLLWLVELGIFLLLRFLPKKFNRKERKI
jgi:hypothetical protein